MRGRWASLCSLYIAYRIRRGGFHRRRADGNRGGAAHREYRISGTTGTLRVPSTRVPTACTLAYIIHKLFHDNSTHFFSPSHPYQFAHFLQVQIYPSIRSSENFLFTPDPSRENALNPWSHGESYTGRYVLPSFLPLHYSTFTASST